MFKNEKLLLLDDDRLHLSELARYLEGEGLVPLRALTVEEAILLLPEAPDFAIVDVFLAGDDGAELSDRFIAEYLEPNGIRYGRMTSAPSSVPENRRGEWVLHKREFWNDPATLFPLLVQALSS